MTLCILLVLECNSPKLTKTNLRAESVSKVHSGFQDLKVTVESSFKAKFIMASTPQCRPRYMSINCFIISNNSFKTLSFLHELYMNSRAVMDSVHHYLCLRNL